VNDMKLILNQYRLWVRAVRLFCEMKEKAGITGSTARRLIISNTASTCNVFEGLVDNYLSAKDDAERVAIEMDIRGVCDSVSGAGPSPDTTTEETLKTFLATISAKV
jgi:hypothetical protein